MKKIMYIDKNGNIHDSEISEDYIDIFGKTKLKIICNKKSNFLCFDPSIHKIRFFKLLQQQLVETDSKYKQKKDLFFTKLYSLRNAPEYSLSFNNDLFLLNHRCGSSTVKSTFLYIQNKLTYEEYCVGSYKSYGWGRIYNNFDQTSNIIKKSKPKIFMFFRDPIEYFISCFNIYVIHGMKNVDDFIGIVENGNRYPNSNLDENIHSVTQSSMFLNLGLNVHDIRLIDVNNIDKFFKIRYNVDVVKKNITKRKTLSRDMLSESQIERLRKIYSVDYSLKENVFNT